MRPEVHAGRTVTGEQDTECHPDSSSQGSGSASMDLPAWVGTLNPFDIPPPGIPFFWKASVTLEIADQDKLLVAGGGSSEFVLCYAP